MKSNQFKRVPQMLNSVRKHKIQSGFDFDKMEIVWFDVAYAFGFKKHADPRHGYPITSSGPIVAGLIFFAIIAAAVVLATL